MMRSSVPIYAPSVWDRMIAPPGPVSTSFAFTQQTPDQFKRSIARDLEALLNTRLSFPHDTLTGLPYCINSIVNFGLSDFAHLCLSDSEDRKEICSRLQAAIERHEPRLGDVRVQLVFQAGAINQLELIVSGRVPVTSSGERVRFDLMLEPSSQHYSLR